MSNFNNASLIVTPNAKKAGKLYALKGADLDVVRATTATYVGSDGLIKTALANEVRFDYSNGSCPSILVEPQRTNLVFPSATATTQTRTVTATTHTLSFYGTGTVVLSGVATGTLVGTGTSNKVTLTFAPTAGNLTLTVSGSVTNWQLEAGSNATSSITTVSGSVTRNADIISKTGISYLIGQSEGTLFTDVYINSFSSTGMILSTSIDTTSVRIEIYKTTNGKINFDIIGNTGALAGVSSTSTFTGNVRLKIALGYKSGNTVMFINGIQETTVITNAYDLTGQNRVGLGQNRANSLIFNNFINNASLFKTRLTNTELQQLTTL